MEARIENEEADRLGGLGAAGAAAPKPMPLYAEFRKNQAIFCVDASGDGWSVNRFQPEIEVEIRGEKTIETPSSCLCQAIGPTSIFDPHPLWADGMRPRKGLSATDVERQERGVWSSNSRFAKEPKIPAKAAKRWRDPAGYEHIDQAPHLMPFDAGDRVVYGRPGELGTVVRSAHYLLTSWVTVPENNPVHHVAVPSADVEKPRPDNMPRALGRAPSEVESDEDLQTSSRLTRLLPLRGAFLAHPAVTQ